MTDPTATEAVEWNEWLRRWDAQQEVYIESRERRFEVMVSFLEAMLPPDLLALDLAAGPGSASARLLRRLPGSRSASPSTPTLCCCCSARVPRVTTGSAPVGPGRPSGPLVGHPAPRAGAAGRVRRARPAVARRHGHRPAVGRPGLP